MSLLLDYYDYSLKEVITEFESRFIEPDPVSVDTDGTQVETETRFKQDIVHMTNMKSKIFRFLVLWSSLFYLHPFDMKCKPASPIYQTLMTFQVKYTM